MNLPFQIARRYLFAKKSTNAINIITGITVFGIAIQTAAFVLVLSVFNGFEELLLQMFSNFNPEVKVMPLKGKTFDEEAINLTQLQAIAGVELISKSLEETAFFEYKDNRAFGKIKGVDSLFNAVNTIDSTIIDGRYLLQLEDMEFAVLGSRLYFDLGIDFADEFNALSVYMPKQERVGPLQQPFRKQFLYPMGAFSFQASIDAKYVLSSLNFAQSLLNQPNQISALELKLTPDANVEATKKAIRAVVGEAYSVKDRYEQEETFLKLMNIEKWLGFAILALVLLLVSFNLIGAMWMIVLEKRQDISILKSMGSSDQTVRNIFLYEGLLLCGIGMVIGFSVALLIYFIQRTYGIVTIPQGFLVTAYPIAIQVWDFVAIAAAVMIVGLLASLPAAMRARRMDALVREE
jgi:lipoprotein-releasing system permease protein